MSTNIVEFKTILKKARNTKGITQKKLAELSGLSFSMVSKLESGEQSNPSFETISKLAAALDIQSSYLYGINRIELEYANELYEFLKHLGYDLSETYTPDSQAAGFDEEPTEDYLKINNVRLNTREIKLLESEIKRTIDFFLRINKRGE